MYPETFDYVRAGSVEQALELLASHEDAKVLAGGHSLVPLLKQRLAAPAVLVDIGRIGLLHGVRRHEGNVRVGALTTHAELAASDVLRQDCPLLAEAAATIGDPQVRNKGTLGGNVAHADPASDLPAALLALGATVHIAGQSGRRTVAVGDFFVGLLESAVGDDEVLTAVEIAPQAAGSGNAYLKVEHPASGYAVCGAAAAVTVEAGVCRQARLCFNGVTDTPHDAAAVGGALAGSSLADGDIDAAVDAHLAIADPLGDLYASGEYRVQLAKVYSKRALRLARDRALA